MRVLDLRLFLDKWKKFVPIEGEFVPERKKDGKICYDRKHKGMRVKIKEVSSEWFGNLAEKVVIPVD